MAPIRLVIKRMTHEPFRLFFPLGVLAALIAALYWPGLTYQMGFTRYPSQFHILMMIFGFMWAFIIGFLTTAVPQLTQTKDLAAYELSLLLALYLSAIIGLFLQAYLFTQASFFVTLLYLIMTLARRFATRQRNVPPTFIYLPFGLLSALIATAITIGQGLELIPYTDELTRLARNLLYQGMILFLLIGIGGFLIRSILGWAPALPEKESDQLPHISPTALAKNIHLGAALAVFASFLLEGVDLTYAQALRAVVVTLILIAQVKIHRIPISGKLTSTTLLIALWLLLLGLWGQVFASPQYSIAFRHFCFIGGFALSVFAVATRVIFSHCGYSELLQKRYAPFSIAVTIMGIGLVTRFSATLVPSTFFTHLSYSSFIWCLGVLIWSSAILTKSVQSTLSRS